MILEAITQGPGAQGIQTYVLEIALILLGAFLLGYLFRYFLNDKMKKRMKELEAAAAKNDDTEELEKLRSEHAQVVSQLEQKLEQTNARLGDVLSSKMDLERQLENAKNTPAEPATPPVENEPQVVSPSVLTNSSPDPLRKIEGIGPKIESLLHDGGIKSFADLSQSSPDAIRKVLVSAGANYAVHDPSTWPEQAQLAVDEKWDELADLQAHLKGGKRKKS